MKLKVTGLVILVHLLVCVPAFGGINFNLESDTSDYFTIMDFFLSPYQLTDYNFLGGGARARAMGGAFLAISDDPTAASWNPAGLIQLDKAQMDLSFNSYMQRGETAIDLDSELHWGDKFKYNEQTISFASVVIPFRLRDKEFVVGGLYHKLADIYQENTYYYWADSAHYSDTTVYDFLFPPISDKVSGRLDGFNLAFATKVFDPLSFGMGINIYTGGYKNKSHWFATYDNGYNGLRFYPEIKSDYSGFNLTIGLMYTLEKLRLGGVLKTPYSLKEKNDIKLFCDIVERGLVNEGGSILFSPFFFAERRWKIPTMLGLGASYQVDKLTLAADVELRNYSKSEVIYKLNVADPATEDITTGDQVRSLGWRNITQFRIGAEYMIHTRWGDIPLRIGFRNDPQLYTTELDSSWVYLLEAGTDYLLQSQRGIENGDWVNGNILCLGTGIAWSQIKLDISLEYAKYDDVERQILTGSIPFDLGARKKIYPAWNLHGFSQTYSSKYSRVMVSFTGFF